MDVIEGQVFSSIETISLNSSIAKRMIGRKVLIKRIFTRLGASERSFCCVFLANTKRQKDYEHTFYEFEKLLSLLTE